MLPRREDAAEDGRFSFGSAADLFGDGDHTRPRRPLGSHDYASSRSLDLRKGSSRSYDDLGGHRRLLDYPLPVSRSQTMVKYRQELMARAESMPEGTYELSLRDIVEVPTKAADSSSLKTGPDGQEHRRGWNMVSRWKERVIVNARQQPGVFLLRVFSPFHLRSAKRGSGVVGSKVSPKPISSRGAGKPAEEASGSEDVSRNSSSSSSSKSSSGRRRMSGCYSFLLKKA